MGAAPKFDPATCPCCGSPDLILALYSVDDPADYQVRCRACDCRGGRATRAEEALSMWTRLRSTPQEQTP